MGDWCDGYEGSRVIPGAWGRNISLRLKDDDK